MPGDLTPSVPPLQEDLRTAESDAAMGNASLIRELVGLSQFTEGILRTMGSAVVVVDSAGRIAYVNPAAESLLGASADRLMQQDAGDVLITRGGGPLLGSELPEALTGEAELMDPSGQFITVDVRVSHHPADDGGAGGVVAILTDRTEVKRAEQISRRKDRLASLGELSAGVAHEIRNPLAGIGASAQLLRARLGEESPHLKLTDVILEEVGRLDRIVESLLQFARPPEPRLQECKVDVCLSRALRMVESEAAAHTITVETRFEPDLPPLWLDPDQIEQVVLNLLRNSVQAMGNGPGALTVSARRVSRRPYVRRRAGRRDSDAGLPVGQTPRREWVETEITDTGHGIPAEILDRIFNPFYTTRRQGTGLGLSISQTIVQEHGGLISISSTPGQGTTVTVDLPIEKRRGRRRDPGEPAE